MKLPSVIFLCVLALAYAKDCPSKRINSKLICYYSKLTDIDSCYCTHVILPVDADFKAIEGLRSKLVGVKILLTVNEFNQGLVKTVKQNNIDGLELNLKKLDSKNDITEFINTIRTRLGNNLYLALSVPPKTELLAKYYDLKALTKATDLFILQTAFLGASKNVTFHPSRLSGMWDMQNTDSVVDLVTGLGAPLSRLAITAPVQAFKFTLQDKGMTTPGSPALELTSMTRTELCEKMSNGDNWTLERDQDQAGPYIFREKEWISFEDATSMDIKAKYARVRGLAGIALKDLSQDHETTKCGGSLLAAAHAGLSKQTRAPRGAVLRSLEREILETPARPLDTVHVSPYRISRVIDVEGHVHVIRQDTRTEFECSRQGYFVHPHSCGRFYRCVKFDQQSDEFSVFEFDCPAGLAFDERVEVCVWPGSLTDGAPCSGSSEIAPVPRERFVCPSTAGYYADPENCRWFFACLDHGKSGLTAYEFRCPFGLVFDEHRLLCEWPWLVPSCKSGHLTGLELDSIEFFGGAAKSTLIHGSGAAVVGLGHTQLHGLNAGAQILESYDGLGSIGTVVLGGYTGDLNLLKEQYVLGYDGAGNLAHTSSAYHGGAGEGQLHLVNSGAHLQGASFLDGSAGLSTVELHGNSGYDGKSAHLGAIHSGQGAVSYSNVQQHNSGNLGAGATVFETGNIGISGLEYQNNAHNLGLVTSGRHGAASIASSSNIDHGSLQYNSNAGYGSSLAGAVLLQNGGETIVEHHGNHGGSAQSGEQVTLLHSGLGYNAANEQESIQLHGNSGFNANNQENIGVIHFGTNVDGNSGSSQHSSSVNHGESNYNLHSGSLVDVGKQQESLVTLHGVSNSGENLASVEYHGNAGYDNQNIHEGAVLLDAGANFDESGVKYGHKYASVDTGDKLSGSVLISNNHGYTGDQQILIDSGAKLTTSTAQFNSNAGYNYNNVDQKTVLLNSGAKSSQNTVTYHNNNYNSGNDKLVLTNAEVKYTVPEQKTVLLDSGVKSDGFSVTHHGGEKLSLINEGANLHTSNLHLQGVSGGVSYENANDHLALVDTGAKVATSTVHLSSNVGHGYENEGQKQVLLDSGIKSGVSSVEYFGNAGHNYANAGEQTVLLNTGAESSGSIVQHHHNLGYNSGENVALSSVEYLGNAGHDYANSEEQVTLLNSGAKSSSSIVQHHQNHGYNSGENVAVSYLGNAGHDYANSGEQVTLLNTGAKSSSSIVQHHQNHGYNSGENVAVSYLGNAGHDYANSGEEVTLLNTGAKSSSSIVHHHNQGYNSGENVAVSSVKYLGNAGHDYTNSGEAVTLLNNGGKSASSTVQFHQNHGYNSGEHVAVSLENQGISHGQQQVTLLNSGAKSVASNIQFHEHEHQGYNSGANVATSSIQYNGNNYNTYGNIEQKLHLVDSGINSGEQYQQIHNVQHTVPVQTTKVVESYELPAKSTVQLHSQLHSGNLDYNYQYANEAKYKYEQPSVQVTSHVANVDDYDKYNTGTVLLDTPKVNYNIQAPTSTSSISYGTKLIHNAAVTPKTTIFSDLNLGVEQYQVPAGAIKQSAHSSSYHYQAPIVQYEQKTVVPYETNVASGKVQSQYYGVQHNQAADINAHIVQQPAVVLSKFETPSSTPKYETHYYTKQTEQVNIPVVHQQSVLINKVHTPVETVSVTPSYESQQIHQVNIPIVQHPAPFANKINIPIETISVTPKYDYVAPIKIVHPKYETYSGPTESSFYGKQVHESVPIQTVTSAPSVVESYSYLPPKQVVSNINYESKQYLPPKPIVNHVYVSSTPKPKQYLPPKPAVFVSTTPKYTVFQEFVQPKQTFEIKKTVNPTVISEYQYENPAFTNYESSLNFNTQHVYHQQAEVPNVQTETVYYSTQKPYVSSTVSVPVVPVKNIETQFIVSTPKPTFVSTIAPIIKQTPKLNTKVVAVTKYDTLDNQYFVSTPKPLYVSTPAPILTETLQPISHLPEFKYYDSRFDTGAQKSDFANFEQFNTKYVVSTPKPIVISTPAPILTETLKPIAHLPEFKYYDSRFDTGSRKSNQFLQETADYSAEFNQFGNYDSDIVVSTAKPAIVSHLRPVQRTKFVSTTPVSLDTYGNYDYYDSQYIVSAQKPVVTSTIKPLYDDSYVVTTAKPIITSTVRPIIQRKKIVSTTTAIPLGLSDYDEYVLSSARPTYEPVKIITPKPKGKTIVRVNDFHPFLTTKLGAQCTCVSNTLKLRNPSNAKIEAFDYDYNLPDNVPVTKLTSSGPAYDDNNEEPGVYVVSNADASSDYDYEPMKVIAVTKSPEVIIKSTTNAVQPAPTPIYTIRKKVTSIRPVEVSSITPIPEIYISSTPAAAIVEDVFLKKSAAPLYVNEDKSKEEKIAEAVNEGLSLVKSAIKGYVKEAVTEETRKFDRYGPGGWRSRDETLQGSVDCQRAGLFRHPTQCNKFYACHWDCKKERYTLHVFNCPVHLTFDSTQGACNWPSKGPACTDNTLLPSA